MFYPITIIISLILWIWFFYIRSRREYDGSLWLSTKKPIKESIQWIGGSHIFKIQSDAFPEVKWEDEEPRELILK